MAKRRILVVDDEKNMQTVLRILFEADGWETDCVDSGDKALALVDSGERYAVVVSDLKMDGLDGLGLLRGIHERSLGMPFVLMTAYGTVEKAVEAMKLGAVDVVTKPFTKEAILSLVNRIAQIEELRDENSILKAAVRAEEMVCRSPRMAAVADLVQRIGPVSTPVLLTGESGTGKEVLARAIHRAFAGGDFDSRPFVSVNCPAVPENLLESELFGYRKGAFTGASQDFKGKVELADSGSLFFDEIGDLPPAIQPKLLRLLENRTYEPLGSGKTRQVDIRVICATNRPLARLMKEGRFREDLLYRINTFTVEIPPLRERREDIPELAAIFLARYRREMAKPVSAISDEVLAIFGRYGWPGNIRELKNVIERAVVLCEGGVIRPGDLPLELRGDCDEGLPAAGGGAGRPFLSSIEQAECRLIEEALKRSGGNISEAARGLGITRNTLRYRLRKYGLDGGGDAADGREGPPPGANAPH
jgi:DNA-binding NtrC family response regulator